MGWPHHAPTHPWASKPMEIPWVNVKKLAGICGLSLPQNMVQLLNAEKMLKTYSRWCFDPAWPRDTHPHCERTSEPSSLCSLRKGTSAFKMRNDATVVRTKPLEQRPCLASSVEPLQNRSLRLCLISRHAPTETERPEVRSVSITWFCGCLFSMWNLHALQKTWQPCH